jgi:sugar phosphate permease
MFWAKLFFPFAGAYFLSYHFRTVNAVIGPLLSEELTLGAADLGLLTSAYFIAFGAAQLPLGLLLDRFGARKVESILLLFAAVGAAIFANGHTIGTLAVGRGMIGLGVSACLMASFKSFSLWFPQEKQASLTGWIMTSGTLGALAASAPLDAALHFASWRSIFYALSLATVVTSGWLFFGVPDEPGNPHPETLSAQLEGIRHVLSSRHFWRYAPLGFAQIGGFMAVQSLWSSAWLIHVNGYSRSQAADHLAAMSLAMMLSYALIGLLSTGLARRGIGTIYLLAGGMAMCLLSLFLIISQSSEQHYLLWIAYGLFSSFGTLLYTQTASGFPVALSGRANTLLNLLVFLGAFSLQWGMGVLIDQLESAGFATNLAHRHAFSVLFILQAAALLWLLIGGIRRLK